MKEIVFSFEKKTLIILINKKPVKFYSGEIAIQKAKEILI